MVDARDLKSLGSSVRVRVPPPLPWSSSLMVERSDLYPEAQIRDRSRFESEEDHQNFKG